MSIQLSGCTQLTSFGKAKLISLCFNTQLLSQGTESSTSQPCTVSKLARATEETGRKSRMIRSYITQSASITSCSLNRVPVSLSEVAQEFLFILEAELEVSGSLCQEPSHFQFMLETCGPLTPSPVSNSGWKIWHWICGAGCPLPAPPPRCLHTSKAVHTASVPFLFSHIFPFFGFICIEDIWHSETSGPPFPDPPQRQSL